MKQHQNSSTNSHFKLALLLIVASAVVRLGSSLYLPALLTIGHTLHLNATQLSFTLTIFFISFAAATLFAGALADAWGRKNTIIWGCILFIAGSTTCAVADSFDILVIGRILQAWGASCIPVAGRAMIRDLCSDIEVIIVLGWTSTIGGLVPIIAPMLGGVITDTMGWRYDFWFLVLFSSIALLTVSIKLPHSLPHKRRSRLHLGTVSKNYLIMLRKSEFIIVMLPLMFAFAIQGAYLAVSPFVFMQQFSLSPWGYGFANAIVVISMLAGRYIATTLLRWYSIYHAYLSGSIITLAGGIVLLLVTYLKLNNLAMVLLSLAIAVTGFGTMLPIGIKSIMTAFRNQAGCASALHSCLTLGMAAVGSFIVFIVKNSLKISALESLAALMVIIALLAVFTARLTKPYLR